MPSGPKKRKSARRKNEAAKGQGQQRQHSPYSVIISDKYTEKDASLCGSLEEQDEEFSSPSPQTPHQNYRLSSSEAKDERLSNTEEWVRVSNFGARPCQGKIESQGAASEDPDIISPSISGPSDKLVDWETISNSSFPENSQCAQTSESESKPKVLIGNTDLDVIDAYISNSKPSDDNYIEAQFDSGIEAESGSKATEKNSMEENYSERASKEIVGIPSARDNNFDPDYKTGTTPRVNVEELKSKQQNHIFWDSDSHGKPESEEVCCDFLDNDKEKTVVTSLSDEHMTADLESVAPKVVLAVSKGKEIAVTPLNEEDAEQNVYKPEVVDIEGNKETAILTAPDETDTAKEGMMDTEGYSRGDNELPGSAGIMDKEASLSVCGDACQKSFEKKSSEISDVLKSDVENSLIGPESTRDVEKEGLAKSQVCVEVINYRSESSEDGDLASRKDNNPEKPYFSNLESHFVSTVSADANGFIENSFQQLDQHKVADHAPLVSEEVKTEEIYLEDETFEIPGSHKNQVEEGTSDHKRLTSWKDCCGAFEWLFGWSR